MQNFQLEGIYKILRGSNLIAVLSNTTGAVQKTAYAVELQHKLELEAQEDQYMVMVYPTSGLEED